jgi:hypothetical protein
MLNAKQLKDILMWRGLGNLSYEKIAKNFETKYGFRIAAGTIRNAWLRFGPEDESVSIEDAVDQLRKTFKTKKQNRTALYQNKTLLEYLDTQEGFIEGLERAIKNFPRKPPKKIVKKPNKKRKMTLELLLSDLHVGMLFHSFNYKIARQRIRVLIETFIEEIKRESIKYDVEHLIVALLGDIINSATMHGKDSAAESEFGNSEQMVKAIDLLFNEVFVPLSELGIPITVPSVTGNHDRVDMKRTYLTPGTSNRTYVIYKGLEMLCDRSGFAHIKFLIPEEAFTHLKVYGNTIFYEHGDVLKSCNKLAIDKLIQKRQVQIKGIIHFFRIGHFHEYTVFGQGKIIVNASFCGRNGYASTLGLVSCAAQAINSYVETRNRPTCFFKSFPVYLGE